MKRAIMMVALIIFVGISVCIVGYKETISNSKLLAWAATVDPSNIDYIHLKDTESREIVSLDAMQIQELCDILNNLLPRDTALRGSIGKPLAESSYCIYVEDSNIRRKFYYFKDTEFIYTVEIEESRNDSYCNLKRMCIYDENLLEFFGDLKKG